MGHAGPGGGLHPLLRGFPLFPLAVIGGLIIQALALFWLISLLNGWFRFFPWPGGGPGQPSG